MRLSVLSLPIVLPLTVALAATFAACAGEEGAPGATGAPGADGADGIDGVDGTNGTDGTDGTNGVGCTVTDNNDGTYTVSCGGVDVVVTDPDYVPAAYTAADGMQGGTAYAKWWVTQAGGAGTLAAANVTVGAEWVRCKTCHAWDGLGNAASYANRTGKSTGAATRPDVSTVDLRATIASSTPLELFAMVRGQGGRDLNTQGNGHPDYSTALTDAQVWNIVKFMREEWIYPDDLYFVAVDGPPVYSDGLGVVIAPTVTFYGIGADGDAVNGNAVYTAQCGGCHGATGTTSVPVGASIGELIRTKPHEMWHKAKFGNISDTSGAVMDPGMVVDTTDMVDLYRALSNTVAFPDG